MICRSRRQGSLYHEAAQDTARGARGTLPRYGPLRAGIRCDARSKARGGAGMVRAARCAGERAAQRAGEREAQRAGARVAHGHDTATGPTTRPTLGCDTAKVSATTRRWAGHDTATRARPGLGLCALAGPTGCALGALSLFLDSLLFLSHF